MGGVWREAVGDVRAAVGRDPATDARFVPFLTGEGKGVYDTDVEAIEGGRHVIVGKV